MNRRSFIGRVLAGITALLRGDSRAGDMLTYNKNATPSPGRSFHGEASDVVVYGSTLTEEELDEIRMQTFADPSQSMSPDCSYGPSIAPRWPDMEKHYE